MPPTFNLRLLRTVTALLLGGCGLLAILLPALAKEHDANKHGLRDAIILIIRHAEKPDKGDGLSTVGEQHAKAYVRYFQNYTIDAKPLAIDRLYAAADSKDSRRPRLTLEPFSKASGLRIDSKYEDDKYQDLVDAIRKQPAGKHILICWHHEEIPHLLGALGADSKSLIGADHWPDDVYNWVIQLRYDSEGKLSDAKRITEPPLGTGSRR